MKPDKLKTPVTILTGLGIPTTVETVLNAYQRLMDWPAASRDNAHAIATNACLAALNGHVTPKPRADFSSPLPNGRTSLCPIWIC
jgi:hypothetical protein